jgi:prepilin-type N-terminal cleavage/methylation domain-containing protein
MMIGARWRHGFTVIELLIVIVIFGLISVMLVSGQSFALRAWNTQERRIQLQGDVGAVQNAIRQLLVSGRNFEGDNQSLHWVGTLPRALKKGGLFDIGLNVEDGKLFITWRPHFAGPMPQSDPERADLAGDVTDFALSYYVSQDPAPPRWMTTLAKDKKPTLIKVAARLSEGGWPPLIIAPMLDAASPAPAPAADRPAGTAPQPAAAVAGQNAN